jgi:pimeloyl-ACP methyl ester carboxylesterase
MKAFSLQTRSGKVSFALVTFSFLVSAFANESADWRDPSKHKIQFVTVEQGIKLEVLDWGGTGRPIVLLAGYQTAHEYDDIAPKMSEFGHVYGITRRGYGASSRPDDGYTAQRSADDVLAVLDSLKLNAPVLAGHGFGGQDLITIGAQHSERVSGLVFLNSAEDPTLPFSAYGVEEVDPKKLPAAMRETPPPDLSSFEAYRMWQMRAHGAMLPESELRQRFTANPDGTVGKTLDSAVVRDAIFKGRQKPDFQHIKVPVLALFAVPPPFEEQVKQYKPKDEEERAAMAQQYAINQAIIKRHMQDLQAGVPTVHVVTLQGANYYIFLSNEADVLREMRAFINALN